MKRNLRDLNHPTKARKIDITKQPEKEDKLDKRRRLIRRAMSPQYKFPIDNLLHFQPQSLEENCAVCALIAYGHVIGEEQDLVNRSHFKAIGNEFASKYAKKNNYTLQCPGDGYYTDNGHFHINVLHCALQRAGYAWRKLRYDSSTKETNNEDRSRLFIEAVMTSQAKLFVFISCIILTEKQATIAQKHYAVIRKVEGHTTPVLLDGLFYYPMLVCEEVLGRYIELGNLYEVFN
jgi:hypothetical protein